jgi:type II secretory pathway component GspD/PulD (secretin)
VTRQTLNVVTVVALAVVLGGCAAGMAFRRGEDAARRADWDAAVVHYREAVQADPDKPEYKIALERAMVTASHEHLESARGAEARGELDAAVREYRRASEYDPSNRQAAAKVAELDRIIRDRIEASRPKPAVEQMRERARQMSPQPELNPASREPLNFKFNAQSVREILNFIGAASGINITFSQEFREPPPYTVQLDGVTLEQALQQILSANNLFYKVLNPRTILVIPDTAQNRAKYEEQVVRVFYLSHADATEVAQIINGVLRIPGVTLLPAVIPNKTKNTLTVRGSAAMVEIIERVVEANDRPAAEVVLDVQILEVNRNRAKQFGLNLSQYSITGIFSPETAPTVATGNNAGTITVPPFNANTISAGISAADWYLTVPQAIVNFLESDTQTRLVAKPQLRGSEGQKITLNLGDKIPVVQTSFASFGGPGSVATQPLSSYTYQDIGVNVIMTPRVTFEDDIVLELKVESSTLGNDINIAGQNLPTFGNRSIETRIRLRDGESTLLAGLLREDQRRALRGIIGLMRVPGFRDLFSNNDNALNTTDIVMLITPHIVRTHELRQTDVNPIYIGTQQSIGLGGPPPLIAPTPEAAPAPGEPAPQQPGIQPAPPGTTLPTPGVLPNPPAPQPQPPPQQTPPPPQSPEAAAGVSPSAPGTTTGFTSSGFTSEGTTPNTTPSPQGPPVGAVPPGPAGPATTGPAGGTTTGPAGATTSGAAGATPPRDTAAAGAAGTPAAGAQAAAPTAQITITPPGSELRVGGGPYTVPVSINDAPRLTTLSVSITYNPSLVRVRSVQEGSFMRQGGVSAAFNQQVDPATGRVDITVTRGQDMVGASGTGLVAALLVDAVAPGSATFSPSGAATGPAGTVVTVQAAPVTVTVK